MFLKRIEAQGFKSFAHPTKITFKEGFTVIVGPNGSGKSNINDAIKWVLGETSRKNLRATSAKDMIFSGSEDEKAADFAEVSLIFNNEEQILNIDFNEVQITRRSYRNQDQNEYFINKELVRRKDIKNLFLDTGLGNTDLSIISQGSVTKIMDAKPDDLKQLLEEAAGVSRYKYQKTDAIKKLDKTSQNLDIFSVKLAEMDKQIKPLERQSKKATKFLEIKEQLASIELPLIKSQLTNDLAEKETLLALIQKTEVKRDYLNTESDTLTAKSKSIQEKILDFEKNLYALQTKQNELSQSASYSSTTKTTLEDEITKNVKNIEELKAIIKEDQFNGLDLERDLQAQDKETTKFELEKNRISQQLQLINFNLEENRNQKSKYSFATKKILENKDIFNVIYGTVIELIEFDDKYDTAILVGLGNKLKNLVVNNQETIQEAINFLKKYNYGTTTFIPAEQVQPNQVNEKYRNAFTNLKGYLGPLASVIKTKSQFNNVVSSVAGNILLFENLEYALRAAKQSGYKFTIVTLEGEVIYPGFTVKGGSQSTPTSKINEELLARKNQTIEQINQITKNFEDAKILLNEIKENSFSLTKSIVRSEERVTYLESNLHKLLEQFEASFGVAFDLTKIEGSTSTSEYSVEQLNRDIKKIQDEKAQLSKTMIGYQSTLEEFRKEWGVVVAKNSESKISLERVNQQIDKNLLILNHDYKLTWDALKETDFPEENTSDVDTSILQIELRTQIDNLGFVNLDAIESYNDLAVDFDKLSAQTEDLILSKDKLLSTIAEMDEKMEDKFINTFDKVNVKFQKVFTKILGGGHAKLNYIDEENKLDSGLFIEAMTPGKKVQNINLYSGGERSMIALSLIFAINEVNNLPLLLLDEVEAALDEANVDRFSNFAKELNKNTQLIITTHRPGTMEKADILYGVTMQQRGITKIVSVELEDAMDMAEE